ncbi:MAG: hypothetical protein LBQ23_04045 [Puniceicoccales bacterium]|jgi:hypothetical protein|nr:hypothetical protein [Puniceicoccales bacterium]
MDDFWTLLNMRTIIANDTSNPSKSNLEEIHHQLSQHRDKLSSLPGFADALSSIDFYSTNCAGFNAAISSPASISSTNQDDANAARAKLRAIEDLVTNAISTFSNDLTDENLSKVKCALRAIKDFPGASSISPSIADAITVIENYFQDTILL